MIDYDHWCRRCKNYEFNMSDGILCGLTHQKPDFMENCPDFVQDAEREHQNQETVYPYAGDEVKVQERLELESRHKAGANWFFWIAGLSLVNSVISLTGGQWGFIIGLGITQIVDSIVMEIAAASGTGVHAFAILIDLFVAGIFAFFGLMAHKGHQWAFIVGMSLYAADGLLFLMVEDYLSIGFHLFALYGLFRGFSAGKQLKQEQAEMVTMAS